VVLRQLLAFGRFVLKLRVLKSVIKSEGTT